jgi:hypothetical protein
MIKSVRMSATALEHMDYTDYKGLQEIGDFISGKVMDTLRIADKGSRQTSQWHRWMLKLKVVKDICREKGCNIHHAVDLFCEEASAQFPRMVTERWSPHALWQDALARKWHHLDNPLLLETDWLWAFPPPHLLNKVATRLTEDGARAQPMLLVVPHQPTRSWWVKLLPLIQGEPTSAGPLQNLIPPEGYKDCDRKQKPPNWRLCVLRLRSAPPARQGSPAGASASLGSR